MNPNTVVTLYATDFDISNRYVVKAESEGEALGAVSSFPSKVYPDCYWQRDASAFRATGNINDVKKYNYCTFDNNGKLNFAFITDFTYINDDMTLCHIEIDPWLNYAGQYTFNDSPMIRCHPIADDYTNLNVNFYPEPIGVHSWDVETKEEGFSTEDAKLIHIVTAVKTTSYSQNGIDNYFDGMLSLAKGESVSLLKSWASQIQAGSTAIGATGTQPNTSIVSPLIAGDIIQAFVQNGRAQDIIGMYHVPLYFNNAETAGTDLADIPNYRRVVEFNMTWGNSNSAIVWKKMKYSPQFNKLYENLCGNTRMIPVNLYKPDVFGIGRLNFEVFATQGINGNAILTPNNLPNDIGHGYYSVASPSWDRVQLSTYGVDLKALQSSILSTTKTAAQDTAKIIGDVTNPFKILNPAGAFANAAADVIGAGIDMKQGNIQAQTIIQEGAEVVGTASSTIAAYNESNPLVKIAHYFPSMPDILRLNAYFGTYGYSMGGSPQRIVFGNYPRWNYYETLDASISGRLVPQKDLMKIINRFNNGIFIFNTVGDYKKFGFATANHL